jgi:valyl-tRNA synthetase
MHLKDFDHKKPKLEIMDKWLLSRLQELFQTCSESFDAYEYSKSKHETEKFFWNIFCEHYLEIIKDRLYNPEQRGQAARKSAQYTLYTTMLAQIKLLAPIMPHVTEELYQLYYKQFEKHASIHHTSWPMYEPELIDKKALESGDVAIEIIEKVRKFKSDSKLSMNAEISELTLDKKQQKLLDPVLDDLKAVTKAKTIIFKASGIKIKA